MRDPFTLLAIISAVPGACLAFKRFFFHEIRSQLVDLDKPGGIGPRKVSWPYRVLAYFVIGPQVWRKQLWLDLFKPETKIYQDAWYGDDKEGVRILGWFFATFVFAFLAWFFE